MDAEFRRKNQMIEAIAEFLTSKQVEIYVLGTWYQIASIEGTHGTIFRFTVAGAVGHITAGVEDLRAYRVF